MAGGHNLFAAPLPSSSFSSSHFDPSLAIVTTHTQMHLATSCLFFVPVYDAAPCRRCFGSGHRGAVLPLCQHAIVSSTDCQTPHLPLPSPSHSPTQTHPSTLLPQCSQRYNTYCQTTRATLQGVKLGRFTRREI